MFCGLQVLGRERVLPDGSGRSLPPLFIDTRRGGYMHGDISEVVVFPPNRGRIVCSCCCRGTGEYGIGRGSRPWKPFSQAGIVPASCDSYGHRGGCCWSYRPSRLTWRGAEGTVDGGLALVKVRTPSEGTAVEEGMGSWQRSGGSNARHVLTGR